MPDFKDMLKYFRTRENLSQSELAKHIGVSTSTISMYEAGNREPDFETEEKIADFFNTDLNTLRGRDIESRSSYSDLGQGYHFDIEASHKESITMQRKSTSDRLKQIMNEKNLRQVDILELALPFCIKYNVKMNKSDISQYVSGKTEPSQEKLVVLGMALGVTESWLMGFDVPREHRPIDYFVQTSDHNILVETKHFNKDAQYEQLNRYLHYFYKLNEDGTRKVLDYASDLAQNPKYTSASSDILQAAHERTDIEVTDEMRKHDDDIMSGDDF